MSAGISTPGLQAAVLCLALFLSVGMVAYGYGDKYKVQIQQALQGRVYSASKLRQQAHVAARRRRWQPRQVAPLHDIAEEIRLRPTQKVVE